MTAHLLVLILALSSQVGGRYGDAAAAEGTTPAAPEAATPAATSEGAASQITLPPETPEPTLVSEPPAATASGAGELDESAAAAAFADPRETAPTPAATTPAAAPPAASSAPLTLAPSTSPTVAAPPAATSAAPAEAPESSVLVGGPKPGELMQLLLKTPQAGQLPGVALSLGDAMRGATERVAQTDRVQAYWDLSAAVTQYYLALQESLELAALRQGVAQPADVWQDAALVAAKRIEATRQSATTAQLRLHRIMGSAAGASLPLPADTPHCGRYNTRYSEIFSTHMDPAARQLNELIPLLHSELAAQARQVAADNAWLAFVSEHRDPANDGAGLLHAYELMALRRREFVASAREYNQQIAAYSELAAPEQVGPDRLVAMLIRVSNPSLGEPEFTGETSSTVEPASATEPVAEPSADDLGVQREEKAPRTFAFRPLKRLLNRERSIVTTRLLRLPNRPRD